MIVSTYSRLNHELKSVKPMNIRLCFVFAAEVAEYEAKKQKHEQENKFVKDSLFCILFFDVTIVSLCALSCRGSAFLVPPVRPRIPLANCVQAWAATESIEGFFSTAINDTCLAEKSVSQSLNHVASLCIFSLL